MKQQQNQRSNTLRGVRNHYGLSQKEVAAKLGNTVSNYSHYETDPFLPSDTFLEKLAKVYDCTIEDIKNYQPPTVSVQTANNS